MRTRISMWGSVLSLFAIPCALAGPLGVSSATFDMSGTITVTPTSISWNSAVSPFLAEMFTLSAGSGPIAAADGQNMIYNLNISSEPVGTTFPAVSDCMLATSTCFITFTAMPSLPDLDLTYLYAGTGGSMDCTASPAVGQTCTPPNPGGSPFTFTNDPGGSSDAKFVFAGVTSDGLDSWQAIFTSQFLQPYQGVLGAFGPTGAGFVSNTYSATVYIAAIPEPGSFVLVGLGAGLLFAYRKYRLARA